MTISEIAKLAGVSNAAVSRYMNNGYISEEKKERIKKVIDETGYRPTVHAQMLRTGKTNMIGVILPKIDSYSTSRTVAGINGILQEKGYRILLTDTENHEDRELEYLNFFQNNQVDGILLFATVLTPQHNAVIRNSIVPVVVVGQETDITSCVYHDDYKAAEEIAKILLKSGGKKLGALLVPEKDKAVGMMRSSGLFSAAKKNGIALESIGITRTQFALEDGYRSAENHFRQYPDTDMLFCATDTIAIGALAWLKDNGRKIPEEISVTGLGDNKMACMVDPKLTTAHYFYRERGEEAARMILELLENKDCPKRKIQLGYQIEIRRSVKQKN